MSPVAPTEHASARERWASLRAGGHAASGLEIPTLPTDVETAAGPARMALGPGGEPRLLLPLPKAAKLPKLLTTPALYVGDATYHHDGAALRFIELMCRSKDLEPVFAEVSDEILGRIRHGATCIEACRSTLEDFHALLVAQTGGRVTSQTIIGLVGELLLLDRLLELDAEAWRVWRGPLGERHDFRAGHRAIEVKSTSRAGNSVILIPAIDQLLPPTGGTLHLLHLVLEAVPGGTLSVDALVRSVKSKAREPDEITSRLLALECTNPAAPEWNRLQFRLENEALYVVKEGFPRLIPSTFGPGGVPAGVAAIQYQVDLASAFDYQIHADEAQAVTSELLVCLSQG